MAAVTPTVPTLLPGKVIFLKLSVMEDVDDVPTLVEKTYPIGAKNFTDAADKIQTDNQTDNGWHSHIFGFRGYTGTFTMYVDSEEALAAIYAGNFIGCSWSGFADQAWSGTIGLSNLSHTADPNGAYQIQGTYELSGEPVAAPGFTPEA